MPKAWLNARKGKLATCHDGKELRYLKMKRIKNEDNRDCNNDDNNDNDNDKDCIHFNKEI